jgi:choline monooxygenase
MAVAQGDGCQKAFVCTYHAWTYGLDGKLKHIPGDDGFPDLDKAAHGLIEVKAEEQGGIVFVTQEAAVSAGALDEMPDLIEPDQLVFEAAEVTDKANWKLIGETSMEGYHIKALRTKPFYPYGFDNLNAVETYGANSRIVFRFRRVEKLRDIPREKWRAEGMVTDTYQLFPNSHISKLPNHALLIILEPIAPNETKWVIYKIMHKPKDGSTIDVKEAQRDAGFVQDGGLLEDRAAATSIQDGLATNANSEFLFGRYEKAICHFHKTLTKHLEMAQ